MTLPPPAFVVVEGIEASGKSTLLAGLAASLRDRGVAVRATREPGGTPLGDRVRAVFLDRSLAVEPLAEAFLIAASRAQHVARVIRPALEAGELVLCDRFELATFAYQGYGRGIDLALLRSLSTTATGGLRPTVTLLVDVPPDVSKARVLARARAAGEAEDRLEAERDEFHARVRAGYLEMARDDARIRILDGTRSPAQVLQDALDYLNLAAM